MFESFFGAFILRTAQAAIEASPTLLIGVLIAGILRRMVGPAGTRKLFGAAGWTGLLRAWGMGMLLPVCSLGVLPVARELRRAGVRGRNVLAFVLVAPLLNPISFLYGLTLANPVTILCYAAGSLVLALVCGLIWERLFPTVAQPDPPQVTEAEMEPLPAPGLRRILAVFVTAARELTGPLAIYYAVGLLASGLVSASIPYGGLQRTMQHDDPLSPLLMALIATPAYMGPLPGMMRIGLMFEHGNSVGAAFVLLVLGISMNVGLIAWMARAYRLAPTLGWLGLVATTTLGIAYIVEKPLFPSGIEAADHTHAFDDFSSPFTPDTPFDFAQIRAKIAEKTDVLESAALPLLLVLMLCGLIESVSGLRPWLEAFLTAGPPPGAPERLRPKWDVTIPGPVLGAISLAGLVVFSVVSAYIYYPPRGQLFDEMAQVRAEAVSAVRLGKREEAIRQLERWDLLSRKLQVGVFLRQWHYDVAAAKQGDDFREAMEEVRDALLAGDGEKAKQLLEKMEQEYAALKKAYSPPGASAPGY